MPIVHIRVVNGHEERRLRLMLSAVTDAVTTSLGIDPSRVRVLIDELPADRWAAGGVTIAEREREEHL